MKLTFCLAVPTTDYLGRRGLLFVFVTLKMSLGDSVTCADVKRKGHIWCALHLKHCTTKRLCKVKFDTLLDSITKTACICEGVAKYNWLRINLPWLPAPDNNNMWD